MTTDLPADQAQPAPDQPASPENASAENASTPSRPRRNPVERIIVWGAILAMTVVVVWEGSNRFGYGRTLQRIQQALQADEGANPDSLSLDEAAELVSGYPSHSTEEGRTLSLISYRWQGLLKNHGGIHLTYDTEDRVVTGLFTDQTLAEEIAYQQAVVEDLKDSGLLPE